ncbi:contractile injection system tape measure protein [Massilia glaciei]|uniref:Uncharacterized protein n=1 Tax=Massilia glaciei TaxID=1524097 RepID=A0A2U2HH89_9BURK|nr:hypothetical protein C7C56_018470 [Massilia glaciei]
MLATGHWQTPEHYLMFNKLLCGLPLQEPLELDVALTEHEIGMCESLLHAVVKQWSGIGEPSLEGFRGSWLVRDGSLSEHSGHWQLTVEKRAYDILLQRSPFSFSMLRLPWMEKAIHVAWLA